MKGTWFLRAVSLYNTTLSHFFVSPVYLCPFFVQRIQRSFSHNKHKIFSCARRGRRCWFACHREADAADQGGTLCVDTFLLMYLTWSILVSNSQPVLFDGRWRRLGTLKMAPVVIGSAKYFKDNPPSIPYYTTKINAWNDGKNFTRQWNEVFLYNIWKWTQDPVALLLDGFSGHDEGVTDPMRQVTILKFPP